MAPVGIVNDLDFSTYQNFPDELQAERSVMAVESTVQ
jgi:hypothetical protein